MGNVRKLFAAGIVILISVCRVDAQALSLKFKLDDEQLVAYSWSVFTNGDAFAAHMLWQHWSFFADNQKEADVWLAVAAALSDRPSQINIRTFNREYGITPESIFRDCEGIAHPRYGCDRMFDCLVKYMRLAPEESEVYAQKMMRFGCGAEFLDRLGDLKRGCADTWPKTCRIAKSLPEFCDELESLISGMVESWDVGFEEVVPVQSMHELLRGLHDLDECPAMEELSGIVSHGKCLKLSGSDRKSECDCIVRRRCLKKNRLTDEGIRFVFGEDGRLAEIQYYSGCRDIIHFGLRSRGYANPE